MRQGTYYLNNSGSKWVHFPKEKILVFHGAAGYCKMRTIHHYESFGNFSVVCFVYAGKMVKVFAEDCNGRHVAFVDYKEKYK
jgi:hypothetical protein